MPALKNMIIDIKDSSYHLDALMNNYPDNIDLNKNPKNYDDEGNNNFNNYYQNYSIDDDFKKKKNVDSADYEDMIERSKGDDLKRSRKMGKIVKGRAKLNENNKNKNDIISPNIREKNKLLEKVFSERNSDINLTEENNINNKEESNGNNDNQSNGNN